MVVVNDKEMDMTMMAVNDKEMDMTMMAVNDKEASIIEKEFSMYLNYTLIFKINYFNLIIKAHYY